MDTVCLHETEKVALHTLVYSSVKFIAIIILFWKIIQCRGHGLCMERLIFLCNIFIVNIQRALWYGCEAVVYVLFAHSAYQHDSRLQCTRNGAVCFQVSVSIDITTVT